MTNKAKTVEVAPVVLDRKAAIITKLPDLRTRGSEPEKFSVDIVMLNANDEVTQTLESFSSITFAWGCGVIRVQDGTSGNGHTPWPNIDSTGSVAGMRARGFWGKEDEVLKALGSIYNVSKVVVEDELDLLSFVMIYEQINPFYMIHGVGETRTIVLEPYRINAKKLRENMGR